LREFDFVLIKELAIIVAQRVKARNLFLPRVGFENLLLCDLALVIPGMPLANEPALSRWKRSDAEDFVTLAAIPPVWIYFWRRVLVTRVLARFRFQYAKRRGGTEVSAQPTIYHGWLHVCHIRRERSDRRDQIGEFRSESSDRRVQMGEFRSERPALPGA
jgi:hypothetical protein